VTASVVERSFRGEPGLELRSGDLRATFLPRVGMTGVSLRLGTREFLALPGGVDALRQGQTGGLPLLAPWANRLGVLRYRAAGVTVDLDGLPLHTDGNGLPIHGLLVGWPAWTVTDQRARGGVARVVATTDVDAPAFPFAHRLEVAVAAHADRLVVDTTVVSTGRRRVPVAFGWHPYLRVPGATRSRWRLQLPARDHLLLDRVGIPTGDSAPAPAEDAPVGRRTFDDLYALGRRRRLALTADDGAGIELRAGAGYPYAQVWVPPGNPFAALEPMTAPTDALGRGTTPLVAPGDAFTARFELVPTTG
jgi:aldose 1-epimerase